MLEQMRKRMNWGLARRWAVILIVPVVAVLIAGRQHVLQRTDDLTIWKGGGMGMFASADTITRFAKLYLVTPDGTRYPLISPTAELIDMQQRFLNYPTRAQFERFERAVKAYNWVGAEEKMRHIVFDPQGRELASRPGVYNVLRPGGPREEKVEDVTWRLRLEYWKIAYDPETRRAVAGIVAIHESGDQ